MAPPASPVEAGYRPEGCKGGAMLFEFAAETVALLALAAFVAGFIDAIAGGGGLITVPAVLLAGATPIEALGTNKLQSVFGSGSATWSYARAGHVKLKAQLPMAAMSLIGSMLGAGSATLLPQEVFRTVLPVVLVVIALYFALKPDISDIDRGERLRPAVFMLTLVPLIGFYDGIFGPGTGSFFMLAFVALLGFGMLKATAHTKLLNFASNLGSLIVFGLIGSILWKTALVMGAGQFLGARLGAHFAMKNGARAIKPLLILVCLALAARLAWQSWNG
jgi:hypothetical protein